MFNPNRDESRDFLFEAWRKYNANEPLTALEAIAVGVIAEHPEYHALLTNRDKFMARDYAPEAGETNPFLHISMHIAIREQIAIDQPHGVLNTHTQLTQKLDSAMKAEHEMMDCLAEMIWQAQRNRTAPDAAVYLRCLAAKVAA
jgi:hypothetical protein